MKPPPLSLRTRAACTVLAAVLLTSCGGLGGSYYPYYPSYPPLDPSHSSGSASSSAPGGNTGGNAGAPNGSSSESSASSDSSPSGSSSESPASSSSSGSSSSASSTPASTPASSAPASSPAASEPPAPADPSLSPEEQQLALYRQEVLRLINAERAKAEAERLEEIEKAQSKATTSRKKELSYNEILPLSMENPALLSAAQERVIELSQMEKLSHKRPDGSSYITILAEHNVSANPKKEIYAAGPITPADVVAYWKTSSGTVDWVAMMDYKYTQMGLGYCVRADGTPYWELILIG